MGPLPVDISDILSAKLGAGEAILSFRVTSCMVCCHCPPFSAVSWMSPLNIPSGMFSGSPGSLEWFIVLFVL